MGDWSIVKAVSIEIERRVLWSRNNVIEATDKLLHDLIHSNLLSLRQVKSVMFSRSVKEKNDCLIRELLSNEMFCLSQLISLKVTQPEMIKMIEFLLCAEIGTLEIEEQVQKDVISFLKAPSHGRHFGEYEKEQIMEMLMLRYVLSRDVLRSRINSLHQESQQLIDKRNIKKMRIENMNHLLDIFIRQNQLLTYGSTAVSFFVTTEDQKDQNVSLMISNDRTNVDILHGKIEFILSHLIQVAREKDYIWKKFEKLGKTLTFDRNSVPSTILPEVIKRENMKPSESSNNSSFHAIENKSCQNRLEALHKLVTEKERAIRTVTLQIRNSHEIVSDSIPDLVTSARKSKNTKVKKNDSMVGAFPPITS